MTVGSTMFDALIRGVDSVAVARALVEKGYDRLIVQKGSGSYDISVLLPRGTDKGRHEATGLWVEWFEYAPSLAGHMAAADLVISHAGSGSIFEALRAHKPLIAVPNPILMHNHQVEIPLPPLSLERLEEPPRRTPFPPHRCKQAELAEHLAHEGYLSSCSPDDLAQAIARMDAAKLQPYEPGNPAGIVGAIHQVVGIRR